MKTKPINVRLCDEDVALAKAQSEMRGIKYSTFLRNIIHEELWKNYRENNTMTGKKPKKNPFDKSGVEKKEAPKKHAAKKTAKKKSSKKED